MSTITGTASGYLSLLTTLDSFLTSTGHCWGLTYTGTGTGRLRNYIGTASSVAETITVTATSSTSFTVSGSVSGSLGTATVGTAYAGTKCGFTIQAGGTAFVSGDQFRFNTSPKWLRRRLAGCHDSTFRTASWGECQSVFDGSNITGYSNRTLPAWVQIECAYIARVKSFAISVGGANYPTAFELQYSSDGSSWSTAMSVSGQTGWASNSTRLYVPSSPPEAKYWRVYFTATTGTQLDITEVRFYGGVTGASSWTVDARVQYCWDAPGVDGLQTIYVPGFTYAVSGQDLFNLCFRGFRFITGIESDPSFYSGVTPSTGTVAMCLRDVSIAYWIVVHGGRAIIITRHTGLYQFAYLGFGLPYETPAEHPYPYIIAAPSNSESRRFDSQSGDYRNPSDPGNSTSWCMLPDGTFRQLGNRIAGTGLEGSLNGPNVTWPYSTDFSGSQTSIFRDNLDGSLPVLPIIMTFRDPEIHVWGELDGVYWTTGFNNSVEAITTIGQIDHIAIPNVMRTGVNHWALIALD